jgi:hypothetical protein
MSEAATLLPEPYIGPRPFEARDRNLFFGREREAHEISSLVLANRFFVLYAASGAGKTSLFNVGIRPLIEDELEILPTVRFQVPVPRSLPDVANVYTYAALAGWAEPRDINKLTRTSLAEFLANRPRRFTQPVDLPMPRLLVFDQFEELFTTHPDRWQQRREFLEQLAEASGSDPDLRVLVVIREDFLARLLSFADTLFNGLKDRYFLEPLRKPAAELAVAGPMRSTGRSFAPGAVEELVRRLMTTRIDIGDEQIVQIEGEFVEPVLLQVVCQTLWNMLTADVSIITLNNVEDVNTSLARFYSDIVRKAAARSGVTERQIREWVEQELITHPGGTRGTVYAGPKTTEGLPNEVVAFLEGKLLRAEFRAGARWLEITHDSLLAPIEQSNDEFFRTFDPVGRIADDLADAVNSVWRSEAAGRRVFDPYPLPVRWTAADPGLVDSWDYLVTVASSGAGWPEPTPEWAAGPGELDGSSHQLTIVLARIPTGRMLVLGAPGSGKTTLMIQLVLDLLATRKSGERVPVLLSAASWNPLSQDLRSWLTTRLSADYPGLTASLPGKPHRSGIGALLAEGLLMPILDGLDEISDGVRDIAIRSVNDALRPGEGVVVTCRGAEYQATVRPVGRPEITLRGAAGIELHPSDPADVARYLIADAGGPIAASRWKPVLENLGTKTPLAQCLTTPLMATLARTIYNPRPGEHERTLRDPTELLSPALANRAALEAHLFEAFIPAAYRLRPAYEQRDWPTARTAEQWLRFLARHLECTIRGPDLAWWELARALPRRLLVLVGALIGLLAGGLLFALMGLLADGLPGGFAGGSAGGLGLGLLLSLIMGYDRQPVSGMRLYIIPAVSAGLIAGLISGLVSGLVKGLTPGVVLGLASALVVGLAAGIKPVPANLAAFPSPFAVLIHDRRTAFSVGLVGGFLGGLVSGLVFDLIFGLRGGIALGLAFGLAAALAASAYASAWPRWQLTRAWLSLLHRTPWRFMAFLEDAHNRGILRQIGAVYQFRHRELQHQLANRRSTDNPQLW